MRDRLRTFISISLVLFAIIGMHYLGWISFFDKGIRSMVAPLSATIYSATVDENQEAYAFKTVDELQQGYTELAEKYNNALVDRARLLLLEDENTELRQQLAFFSEQTITHVGAQVLGRNIDPLGRTILIDKGSRDGIAIDDPVIVGNGVLVGLVIAVEETIATVRLIDDGQSRIASRILNADRSIGLVEGGFGLSVQMNFIPQNEEISVGDLIVTSGLTRDIPAGLLFGTVAAVEREAYQPFQRAVITPAANLENLSLVSVLIEAS